MSPSNTGRARAGTPADAATRLAIGRKYLEVAELVADEDGDPYSVTVAIGLAVLAGIAATDAACILLSGEYARGKDHHEAVGRLERLRDGKAPAKALSELLALKDKSHYGFAGLSKAQGKLAVKAARRLIEYAIQARM